VCHIPASNGFHIGVDLRLFGVVVSKDRVNLRQRQVAELPYDLLRKHAHGFATGRLGEPRPGAGNGTAAGLECPDFEIDQLLDIDYLPDAVELPCA
jgi:hypothetical protein